MVKFWQFRELEQNERGDTPHQNAKNNIQEINFDYLIYMLFALHEVTPTCERGQYAFLFFVFMPAVTRAAFKQRAHLHEADQLIESLFKSFILSSCAGTSRKLSRVISQVEGAATQPKDAVDLIIGIHGIVEQIYQGHKGHG